MEAALAKIAVIPKTIVAKVSVSVQLADVVVEGEVELKIIDERGRCDIVVVYRRYVGGNWTC